MKTPKFLLPVATAGVLALTLSACGGGGGGSTTGGGAGGGDAANNLDGRGPITYVQGKDNSYDVVDVDVVWTAEFAAKGWLQPLKDKMAFDTSAMLKPTVNSATYKGTLYAAPQTSDGALLYYRKDLVPNAPKTWDEMMGMCSIA